MSDVNYKAMRIPLLKEKCFNMAREICSLHFTHRITRPTWEPEVTNEELRHSYDTMREVIKIAEELKRRERK